MTLENGGSGVPPMPSPPAGFAACRVHDGRQDLWADGATRQVTHLVALDEKGSNGGRPTICGLSRFDADGALADLPAWSMGDGVSGPTIQQERCGRCWSSAEAPPICRCSSCGRDFELRYLDAKGKPAPPRCVCGTNTEVVDV